MDNKMPDEDDIEKDEREVDDVEMPEEEENTLEPRYVPVERRDPRRAQITRATRRGTSHLWLISYSDFMTILMIFFLAMYGYAYLAKAALLKAQEKNISYTEFAKTVQDLNTNLDEEIKIKEDSQKIIFQLPEKVLFASGRANLTVQANRTIAELSKSIKLVLGHIVVEGHTDNIPIKSTFRSNWELSAARAFSVIEALIKQGVEPERLSAWGFGQNRPVASNTTRAGRKENRRIEIVLLKQDKS